MNHVKGKLMRLLSIGLFCLILSTLSAGCGSSEPEAKKGVVDRPKRNMMPEGVKDAAKTPD